MVVGLISLAPGAAEAWPGMETNDRTKLEPKFSARVDELLVELRARGYQPRVAATYRDAARQQFIFDVGQLLELLGARPMTRARGGQSCHNHRNSDGSAGSLAADILPAPDLTGPEQAAFFRALGKAANAKGLGWGGNWPRLNPGWKKYGLGWDPGHVQSALCHW